MPFKMTTDLANSMEIVGSSFQKYKIPLGERIGKKWSSLGDEAEISGHVTAMVDLMALRLDQGRLEVLRADHQHDYELGADNLMRIERDEAVAELTARYIRERGLYTFTYSREAALAVGFKPEVATTPHRLLVQVEHLLESVRKSEPPKLNELEFNPGRAVDHQALAQSLEPAYKRVKNALKALLGENRSAEVTGITKRDVLETQSREFIRIARCGEMLYRVADMPEEAARIRPATLRPGQRAENVEDTPQEPSTTETETPDNGGSQTGDGASSTGETTDTSTDNP